MKVLAVACLALVGVLAVAITLTPPRAANGYTAQPVQFTAPPPQTAVLWIGDSFPAGTGASEPDLAYPNLVASQFGWLLGTDAQGGTGFIADGHLNQARFTPLIGRVLDDKATWLADIVVIDAGRNDAREAESDLLPAVSDYLAAIVKVYPKARYVLVVPQFLTVDHPETARAVGDLYRQWAARRPGTVVIDPIRDRWLTDPEKARALVAEDGVHPNDEGHEWYAERFVTAFERAGVGG
jgi:lysophospholipase L1-like esterase